MKLLLRIFSALLVIVLIAFFTIGLFVKSVDVAYTIDIQAPIEKAWNALASHELKRIIYPKINPKTADVQEFKIGNYTYLEYNERGRDKYIREHILNIDSLQLVVLEIDSQNSKTFVEQQFNDLDRITRLQIKESIQGKTIVERVVLFVFQGAITENKLKKYQALKTKIESTPDFNFRVSEQK